MTLIDRSARLGRAFVILLAVFVVAACARSEAPEIGQAGAAGAVAPGTPQDFAVNVGDTVYFTVDSSQVTGPAVATLDRQAAWLMQNPQYAITVEGHADERGTREYNIALGARRAAATRAYLVGRGIDANRVRTISYGKERPVAVCDDESCWSQNRRAVTVLGGTS